MSFRDEKGVTWVYWEGVPDPEDEATSVKNALPVGSAERARGAGHGCTSAGTGQERISRRPSRPASRQEAQRQRRIGRRATREA